MHDEPISAANLNGEEVPVMPVPVNAVHPMAGIGRVALKIENGNLHLLLLVVLQPGQARQEVLRKGKLHHHLTSLRS